LLVNPKTRGFFSMYFVALKVKNGEGNPKTRGFFSMYFVALKVKNGEGRNIVQLIRIQHFS
jgi:hypothetical protein